MTQPTPPDVDFSVKEQAMEKAPGGITLAEPNQEDDPLVKVNESHIQNYGICYPNYRVSVEAMDSGTPTLRTLRERAK